MFRFDWDADEMRSDCAYDVRVLLNQSRNQHVVFGQFPCEICVIKSKCHVKLEHAARVHKNRKTLENEKRRFFVSEMCAFQYARHNGGSCMRTFRWWNSWNAVQCVILVYVFIFRAFYELSHLLWYNMLNRHIKCLFITTNTKLCCTNKRTPHKYHM